MKKFRHSLKTVVIIIAAAFILPGMTTGGDLEPSAPPGPTMHTLEEVYNDIQDVKISVTGAPVIKTGQTTSYAAGDDGDLEQGMQWPNPRFTDNGDGTITDNLTGLIWLKDANALGQRTWTDAFTQITNLNTGTDFSATDYTPGTYDDWRFPNLFELKSLRSLAYAMPALPNTAGTGQWTAGDPFVGNMIARFLSSTSLNADEVWTLDMTDSAFRPALRSHTYYVWPVRGGN